MRGWVVGFGEDMVGGGEVARGEVLGGKVLGGEVVGGGFGDGCGSEMLGSCGGKLRRVSDGS